MARAITTGIGEGMSIEPRNESKSGLRKQFAKGMGKFFRGSDLLRLSILTGVIFATMTALTHGRFLSVPNFESMAFLLPELALLSLAMMVAMLTGGIDLSVVAIANLAGIVAAMTVTRMASEEASAGTTIAVIMAAVFLALVTGAVCGMINGLLISRLKISAILATLGTMQLFTGIAMVITSGKAITGLPELIQEFGNGTWLGIPIPFWCFAVVAVLVWVIVERTPFGFRLRMTGSNPIAAKFSGMGVPSIQYQTYLLTGILASMTGLLMIARTNSAKADYGSSYLLQAILVAVLGGVNPAGGFGSVKGVCLAVLALMMLASGFNMMHLSNFSKEFAWGLFLLVMMVVNHLTNHRDQS